MPLTTAQKAFNGIDRINNLSFTVKMSDDLDASTQLTTFVASGIEGELKQMHTVAPDDPGAIRIQNSLEQFRRYYSLISIIKAIFWFVGIAWQPWQR